MTEFDSNKYKKEAPMKDTAGPSKSNGKPEDIAAKLLEAVRIDSMQSEDEGDIGGVYGGPLPHLIGSEEYMHDIDCGLPAKWIVRLEEQEAHSTERPQGSSQGGSAMAGQGMQQRGKAGVCQSSVRSHQSGTDNLRSALDAALAGKAETDSDEGEVVDQPVSTVPFELPGSAERRSYFSQLAAEGLFADGDPSQEEVDSPNVSPR